ncbi:MULTISPECIES: capsule assembly Wzi family protein [unclassified Spirosoma]|uniref:capsule assembly Wzi family protein n=1 Tax=unclassified Spirosoma TaxID=2621999 RepID=UPI000AA5F64E|nr:MULTISPECIES: capsule assembly Wzi family protein [unclassified Spirosoma]MBN8826905.1 hypothetical protein [Spirosoma sp.]
MKCICLACGLGWLSTATAQSPSLVRPTEAYVEAGAYLVTGAVPFWLRANQSGIVPINGSTAMVRVGLYGDYRRRQESDSLLPVKRLDWGYGLEVVGRSGLQTQLQLPEAYLKVRWGPVELYAGRKRGIVGIVDTLLTSGSYSWSGNAMPLPKIQLGTMGYVPLGFTHGFVAINALYNHGWFANSFVKGSYLHQKALYIRLGKETSRVRIYFGGNHEAQWGGYAPSLVGIPGLSDNSDGRFASDLKAYFRVITASYGTGYVPTQGVISIDQGNRIGNGIGSFDGGIDINLGTSNLLLYRQNLYETGALFYLTNIIDGLQGIRLQRKPGKGPVTIDRILLEFLSTWSQGGSEFVIEDPKRRGRNNYFNHSQYQDGWTYLNRTIGTPFLTPQTEVNPALPASRAIANNRVSLWHLGVSGRIAQQLQWQSRISYSMNEGTYDIPYPVGTGQLSVLMKLSGPIQFPGLGRCHISTSVGWDRGKLLSNSVGGYLGLRKSLDNISRGRPLQKY